MYACNLNQCLTLIEWSGRFVPPFRIESELKLQNRFTREIVVRNESVIFSYFSYKLMFGWHVIKALTVGVCFETEVIDSFLQAMVHCFSSGILMKFSWPLSLISLTKEWWKGEENVWGWREGERERREEKEKERERRPDRLSRLQDAFCRGWLSEKAECISI